MDRILKKLTQEELSPEEIDAAAGDQFQDTTTSRDQVIGKLKDRLSAIKKKMESQKSKSGKQKKHDKTSGTSAAPPAMRSSSSQGSLPAQLADSQNQKKKKAEPVSSQDENGLLAPATGDGMLPPVLIGDATESASEASVSKKQK